MKLRAFLFDFDETVVYANADHIKSYVIAGRKFGLRIDVNKVHSMIGMSAIDILAELFPQLSRNQIIKLRDAKDKIYRKIVAKKNIRTVGGIRNLLDFLHSKKIKVGVISSASLKNIRMDLRKVRLEKYFHTIVGAENVKKHKPSPDPILKAASMLHLKPRECAYIGDSVFDVIAAKRAGAIPYGLTTGFYSEKQLKAKGAKLTFKNHIEVLSFLQSERI